MPTPTCRCIIGIKHFLHNESDHINTLAAVILYVCEIFINLCEPLHLTCCRLIERKSQITPTAS